MRRSPLIALAVCAACCAAWHARAQAQTQSDAPLEAQAAGPVRMTATLASAAPAQAPADTKANAPLKPPAANAPGYAPRYATAYAPRYAPARRAAKRHAAPGAAAAMVRTRTAVPDDTPFAFRGIPLGITLAALRATHMVRATPHESELLCETDIAGGDLGMTIKSDASLTVACRWAHRSARGWVSSHAVVDGAPAADHILRFAHAAAGEPLRLYEMSFVVDGMTAFDLRDLLASRYGAPRVLGAPSLPLLVWDNGASTITICLLPAGGRATLTYLLKPDGLQGKGVDKALKISQFDEG